VLNFETKWLSRDGIVAATYEAGRRLNLIKSDYGVVAHDVAEKTDQRIAQALKLIGEVDRLMELPELQRHAGIQDLKHKLDTSNLSTVCDKRELELPVNFGRIDVIHAAVMVIGDWLKGLRHPPKVKKEVVQPLAARD
jgi:hypothetical protein